MKRTMIETTGKWLLAVALLVPGASGTAMARQNAGSDVPKSKPNTNNPDMQPHSDQSGGKAVPNAGGTAKQPTTPSNATQSTKGGKRDKKKNHNPQTHGAQKHDPSNQA